jgi:hypothetical protein
MGKDEDKNRTQDQGGETGGMTEGQTDPNGEVNNSDIRALPSIDVSELVQEGLMGKDEDKNRTQDQGGETGGMTEGQTDPNGEGEVDLGTDGP